MFDDCGYQIADNPPRLHYGVVVADVDGDGRPEAIVAGFGGPNRVLRWNGGQLVDIANPLLADELQRAIGVAAADIDGDGREEIYVLNTDTYSGRKRHGDRLFALREGSWIDLFSDPANEAVLNLTAGRSVLALDRKGSGYYGFLVANYGGPMRLYELAGGQLVDVGPQVGIALTTGGRAVVAGPLVSDFLDIFAANERGPNFLFRNLGDGRFSEQAEQWGLADAHEHGRGVALIDDEEGFGIVYGNWDGAHRLMVRRGEKFIDAAPRAMSCPSLVRTVIAADFDNDGYEEIFFNNIGQDNRLFGFRSGEWIPLDPGDAAEPAGLGTGAAVADFDGDGRLELLIAHGESGRQPLGFLRPLGGEHNAWLRVQPLTRFGAPARGAVVTLVAGGRTQRRVIDGGSGYLCQMEPVAHFGLGRNEVVETIEVRWPDGRRLGIEHPKAGQLLRVAYPR